jgi:hypothetical protein
MRNLLIIKLIFLVFLILAPTSMAQSGPELTELEKARIEILNLKIQLAQCQTSLTGANLAKEIQSLKQAIESTRPGFEFDISTGTFKPKEFKPNDPKQR